MHVDEVQIIIVDDEIWTAMQISRYIIGRGFKYVEVFDCPREAKNKIDSMENCKTVIVSDYKMPAMTGVEFLDLVCITDSIRGFIVTSVPTIVLSKRYHVIEKGQGDRMSVIADYVITNARELVKSINESTDLDDAASTLTA